MAWTTPRTWTIGEFATKAILDTHIRDNLLALQAGLINNLVTARRTTPVAAPGALANLTWETNPAADWAGYNTTYISTPTTARYQAAANLFFTGATGTGQVQVRIARYDSAAVYIETLAQVDVPAINAGVSMFVEFSSGATDRIYVQAATGATGVAHNWAGNHSIRRMTLL